MINQRSNSVKRIVIDARLSGLEHAGIGRYVQALTESLESQKSKIKNQKLEIIKFSSEIKHYSLAEQLLLRSSLLKLHADLVHFPHFNVPVFYNMPFVVTIHDLLWHEQVGMNVTTLPAWLYGLKYFGYRLVLRHAIMASKAIIVPSQWVSKKIIDRFPSVKEKICVIYEGVSGPYQEYPSAQKDTPLAAKDRILLKRFGLMEQRYLIYTGSLYPHKNVSLVLDILLKFPTLRFVVACARSVFWERFKEEVRERGLEKQVVLAGFVPDEELVVLYRHALAFVFPSKSEGFGLPGLEAMAAGCPVISSNAGALPEIYGEAVEYFDPNRKEELIKKIERVEKEKGRREELILKGRERVKMFTWDKCARETMGVYEEIFSQV